MNMPYTYIHVLQVGSACAHDNPCPSGVFCNHKNENGSGFCEACSGCPTCSQCGLSEQGAQACAQACSSSSTSVSGTSILYSGDYVMTLTLLRV